jgi:leucyl aminopeptidase
MAGTAAILVRGGLDPVLATQHITDGFVSTEFDGASYRQDATSRPPALTRVSVVTTGANGQAVAEAARRGRVISESANLARTLANEPANVLPPSELARRIVEAAKPAGLTTEVLDEHAIQELGMNLLLGVGQGSASPPRLIVLRHEPPGAPDSPVIGLIGKGVTFDTGGISIKPADGMERMKDDMAGGATVIATLRAIAQERVPVRVLVVVPSTENMPGGRAVKPGDVLTGAAGLTVEVNNTDAEGRLILGDGLWYAKKLGATHLVDVATLTGACVVALGKITTGLWATPGWGEQLQAAAARGGERVWQMPLFEDYREQLKSEIADMVNSPGRPAGAITAAMFLKEFTGDTPWAHLDIAGTAWADDVRAWTPKGATGVMIRTLVELARTAGRHWP